MLTPRNILLAILVLAVLLGVVYMLDPTFGGLLKRSMERFENPLQMGGMNVTSGTETAPASMNGMLGGSYQNGGFDESVVENNPHNQSGGTVDSPTDLVPPMLVGGSSNNNITEGFQNLAPSPMPFPDAEKPANCYPKNQLAPQELLPSDPNSKWAQVNPMGAGDIAGKNFLNAGALIGVNTVGQSLRNASWDLRSEPPNPQQQVSPWLQTTISPDLQRRPLEIA